MSSLSKIYAIFHPVSGIVVYVGKCVTSLARRLTNHEYRARSGRDTSPKGIWLLSLQQQGLRPGIRLLEETSARWQDVERKWIAQLRAEGCPLFNVHPGGNGAHTRASLAPEYVALLGTISDARIAEMAHLCRETITYHRRRAGIQASGDRSRSKGTFKSGQRAHNKIEMPQHVLDLLGKRSDGEIATLCGVSREVVQQRRRSAGISALRPRGRHRKGSEHHNAKVTKTIVAAIRAEYIPRICSCKMLGEKYNLNPSTIHDIVKGKTWKA